MLKKKIMLCNTPPQVTGPHVLGKITQRQAVMTKIDFL